MVRLVSGVALLLAATTISGCGGGGATGGVPVFPASGTVKMFGKPLDGATVAFAPQGDQPTAVGTTDAEGNFQLTTYEFGDGAAAGTYKVVISKASTAASGEQTAGGGSAHGAEFDAYVQSGGHDAKVATGAEGTMVPAQYTLSTDTPLTAEVKSDGDNVFNLEIK